MSTEIILRRFSSTDADFDSKLKALLAFETAQDDNIDEDVAGILKDVKKPMLIQSLNWKSRSLSLWLL